MRERVWSTAGVAERQQRALWEQVASEAFVDVAVSALGRQPGLPSSVVSRSFGVIEIARIVTQPQVVHRRRDHISADARDKLFVNLPLTKRTSARQAGRVGKLRPHDFLVVDGSRPFELRFGAALQQVSVCVPSDVLLPRLPPERDWTAVPVDGLAGLGALASRTLLNMATMSGSLDDRAARVLGRQAAELIALALGGALPRRARSSPGLILQAAREEADRSLGDPALSPALVAQRIGISVRYLHRLFSEQGTSFGRWLLMRRLERCHVALIDPRRAHETIAEICWEHGFADPAYFSRAYRLAYGRTPSMARKSGLTAA